jgi:hypothetical protein
MRIWMAIVAIGAAAGCLRAGYQVDPCAQVDCGGHGTCVWAAGGAAACLCVFGFRAVDGAGCVPAGNGVDSGIADDGGLFDAAPEVAVAMEFTTMPRGHYAGFALSPQPVARLIDRHGDLVHQNGTATLSVHVGAGALGGATSVPIVGGVARFIDISYSQAETGVVLKVSDGAVAGYSVPFDVTGANPPPGACRVEDERFATSEGGCKDLATGLVWSALFAQSDEWYGAIWDARSGPVADAWDLGRTNDFAPGAALNDYNPAAACHNLAEGGYQDWRVATSVEALSLYTHMAGGGYLANANVTFWIANAETAVIDMGSGAIATLAAYQPVRCVRGGRKPASRLVVTSAPTVVSANLPPRQSIAVAVRDPDGAQVNSQGRAISISSTTLGALGGTTTASTNALGFASFTAFTLDTVGEADLTIDSPGLSSTTVHLRVGPYKHNCKVEDDRFATAAGGCQQLATGLSWSMAYDLKMTWHEAVWDSASPPGNAPPEADDHGRVNDYAGSNPLSHPDQSVINYCHDLVEGGQADWRLPTIAEARVAYALGDGAKSHFDFATDRNFWNSTSNGSTDNGAWVRVINLSSGVETSFSKSDAAWVVCVRP